jgi:nucleotide-binding universal stress UspA family protein
LESRLSHIKAWNGPLGQVDRELDKEINVMTPLRNPARAVFAADAALATRPDAAAATAGFRDLVVFVDDSPGSAARLAFAAGFAKRQGAHLAAVHALTEPVLPSSARALAGATIMEAFRDQVRDEAAKVRAAVAKAANAEGIDIEYREAWGFAEDVTLNHARHADATIVPQPARQLAPDVAALGEALVLGAGRPVILVPESGTYSGTAKHVVCAWNNTREATRAVADALPLLRRAEKVSILSIDPAPPAHRIPGADIALHLARHGVKAEATTTYSGDLSVGDALLSRIADLGADFLVMGAYGHSRAREAIFGGATRDVLDHMTVPVLMSH